MLYLNLFCTSASKIAPKELLFCLPFQLIKDFIGKLLSERGGKKTILAYKYTNFIFTGRTNAEVESPILWPPDGKNRLIRKDPDA